MFAKHSLVTVLVASVALVIVAQECAFPTADFTVDSCTCQKNQSNCDLVGTLFRYEVNSDCSIRECTVAEDNSLSNCFEGLYGSGTQYVLWSEDKRQACAGVELGTATSTTDRRKVEQCSVSSPDATFDVCLYNLSVRAPQA